MAERLLGGLRASEFQLKVPISLYLANGGFSAVMGYRHQIRQNLSWSGVFPEQRQRLEVNDA